MASATGSVDLTVTVAGVRLANPLVLASGILGTEAAQLVRVARAGAGAVTAKSVSLEARRGHVNPSCVDFGPGLINAIGLANPGAAAEVELLRAARQELAQLGVPLIASVFGSRTDEYARLAEVVATAEPDLLELNISCPNVLAEFGEPFAANASSAAQVTAAVRRAVDLPIVVKLAPNVPDIARIATAVVDAGADAICAVNTMPGLLIDVESGCPILANVDGGISGPALGPIALHAVYHISQAVSVPIIGTGGAISVRDVLAMIMAGATAVGVGSAVYYHGIEVFAKLRDELADWLRDHGTSLADIRGMAHRRPQWPEPASLPPFPGSPESGGGEDGPKPAGGPGPHGEPQPGGER